MLTFRHARYATPMGPTYALIAANCGALLIFAGMVSFGRWLIARLRLPTDLPEAALFEPRPPPALSTDDGNPSARAQRQQERAEICAIARRTYTAAVKIAEYPIALAGVSAAPDGVDLPSLRQRAETLTFEAEADYKAAVAAMHDEDASAARDRCTALAEANEARLAELDAATADIAPPRSNRFLIIILVMAAVFAVAMALITALLPR